MLNLLTHISLATFLWDNSDEMPQNVAGSPLKRTVPFDNGGKIIRLKCIKQVGKVIKCVACKEFDKFNNKEAQMLDSIYLMT